MHSQIATPLNILHNMLPPSAVDLIYEPIISLFFLFSRRASNINKETATHLNANNASEQLMAGLINFDFFPGWSNKIICQIFFQLCEEFRTAACIRHLLNAVWPKKFCQIFNSSVIIKKTLRHTWTNLFETNIWNIWPVPLKKYNEVWEGPKSNCCMKWFKSTTIK